MRLDAALTPALLRQPNTDVCIIVDVLRASSSCVALLQAGVESIHVAPDIDAARALRAETLPAALLCGEVGGLRPQGFDFGNSAQELSGLDLRACTVVLATSNGTRAVHAAATAPAVFVGCLLNQSAVAHAAVAAARRHAVGISVVCAGNDLGTVVGLDDCFAGGAIVATLQDLLAEQQPPEPAVLTDAAQLLRRLYANFDGQAASAFRAASHGRHLEEIGFTKDLEFCGQVDVSDTVPALVPEHAGHPVLRKWLPENQLA
jgi:2-phosphosulfolactate phosphatase